MVGAFGETMVLDWGLAKIVDREDPREEPVEGLVSSDSSVATVVGAIVGTPAYMSPEQARGEPADTRSDVWSLGVMLFELLTGDKPFQGQSKDDVMAQVRRAECPNIRHAESAVPPELAALTHRALEAEPAKRFQTAGGLAKELERYMAGLRLITYEYSLLERAGRWLQRNRRSTLVAAIALVAIAVVSLLFSFQLAYQRNAAVAAEARARALLADGMQKRAEILHRLGNLPEAEVLAAAALVEREDPVARGIIAAVAGRWELELAWARQAPGRCQVLEFAHDGSVVCAGTWGWGKWSVEGTEQTIVEKENKVVNWRLPGHLMASELPLLATRENDGLRRGN
jgi:hypothetical protein